MYDLKAFEPIRHLLAGNNSCFLLLESGILLPVICGIKPKIEKDST
ncbi:hypothetical protein ACW0KB_14725 [Virgibacillus salarius]|nr:hypothetical protein JUJ52_09710 [Virgibacillus sp. AGTR]